MALLRRLLQRSGLEEILVNFSTTITNALLTLVVIIAAVDRLGVDTTSLIALLGAAGIAVGLALKDSLGNFAAGIMLIVSRPFQREITSKLLAALDQSRKSASSLRPY